MIGTASNKALHQTGRGGAAGFLRRRPVVEARPAGERWCSTHLGVSHRLRGSWSSESRGLVVVTTRAQHPRRSGGEVVNPGSWPRVRHSGWSAQNVHRVLAVSLTAWRGRSPWAQPKGLACGSSPHGLPLPLGLASGSTAANSDRAPEPTVPKTNRVSNNALHQTGRGGAAGFLRSRPVVEARPAGEAECYPDRKCIE